MSRTIRLVVEGERNPYSNLESAERNFHQQFPGTATLIFVRMLEAQYRRGDDQRADSLVEKIADVATFRGREERPGYKLDELTVLFSDSRVVSTLRPIRYKDWDLANALVTTIPEVAQKGYWEGLVQFLDDVASVKKELPRHTLAQAANVVCDLAGFHDHKGMEDFEVESIAFAFLVSYRVRSVLERFSDRKDGWNRWKIMNGLARTRLFGNDEAVGLLIPKLEECKTAERAAEVAETFAHQIAEKKVDSARMSAALDKIFAESERLDAQKVSWFLRSDKAAAVA